jgi:hypothetical protein
VSSVINSYTLETELSLTGQAAARGRGDQFVSLSGTGRYADQPTITYAPLSGEKFAQSLMSPFPINGILSLMQSGYRADVVLRASVSTINGLDNAFGGPAVFRAGSAEFHELLETLRSAQAAGRFDVRLKPSKGDKQEVALYLRPAATPEQAAFDRRIRELLGLAPKAAEIDVVPGAFASNPRQIAILARSMLQVLIDFASYIDVPPSDIAEGRVYALSRSDEQLRMYPRPLQVHSGNAAPADAHAAVRYRDHWFWIDDRDVPSKTVFGFLLLMFSLTETGGQQSAPILTVPTR